VDARSRQPVPGPRQGETQMGRELGSLTKTSSGQNLLRFVKNLPSVLPYAGRIRSEVRVSVSFQKKFFTGFSPVAVKGGVMNEGVLSGRAS